MVRRVAFVVPYALDATLRFVRAAAELPGVHLGIVSQEPAERLPAELRARIAGHVRVGDALDARELGEALTRLGPQLGGAVDALVGILEQLQVPMAEVRERAGIRGMGVEEAHNFRDKARMKDVLRAHGVACARHALATNANEALAFAAECLPLVAKPPAGAGAKNTFRVDRREDLESWLRTVPPTPASPLLLEEFVVGEEHSFDSVSLHGRHLFHSISRYYPSPLEVLETPWIQWCVLLPRRVDGPEYADIVAAGRRTLDALGMWSGLTHMEWFRRPDGSVAISEVAARPPGAQFTTLLSHAHDVDFYRAWARLAVFEEFEVPERRFAAGAAYLRGQGEGRVARVRGLAELERELDGLVVEARLPRPGQGKGSGYEGEGYVVLRHPETEAVIAGLRRLVDTIRVDLE